MKNEIPLTHVVIGTLLQYPNLFARNREKIPPELFYNGEKNKPFIGRVYDAIVRLHERGEQVDAAGVVVEGGFVGADLDAVFALPRHADGVSFNLAVEKLAEEYVNRQYDSMVHSVQNLTSPFDRKDVIDAAVARCEMMLARIRSTSRVDALEKYTAHIHRAAEGNTPRIPTGWEKLNWALKGGLPLNNLSIVGAPPGMGKTSFLLHLGMSAAHKFAFENRESKGKLFGSKQKSVVLIEGEMPYNELFSRLAGIDTGLDTSDIDMGKHVQATEDFIARFYDVPFYIDVCDRRTIDVLRAKIEYYIAQGAMLILVDYLQSFAQPAKGETEYEAVTRLSWILRELSLRHAVHICAASALSRTETGQGKRPGMHSLRGSGRIEHDATIIMFLESEEDADKEVINPVRQITVKLVKNRGGFKGQMELQYELESQRMIETGRALDAPKSHYEPKEGKNEEEKPDCPF